MLRENSKANSWKRLIIGSENSLEVAVCVEAA